MSSEIISNDENLNKLKTKSALDNEKSNYILKIIFDFMKKYKLFEVLKYNKILQKRINLTINDYKNYSQLLTPIEIELKLADNKYGKFINIYDKEEYYHIYLDNSKEEIKRNFLIENENINRIKIIIDHQVKSFKNLFSGCKCITSIFFKKFYRINITNMSYMFYDCSSLKKINFSSFNTTNVSDMSGMFF